MKKAGLLFFITILSISIVIAQNTASVSETGDGNASYVNQLGSSNAATITQIGDLNRAAVADHYASSLYSVLVGTKGISQVGNGNVGIISQTNLYAGTVMAGPEAGMMQDGNSNNATITQAYNSHYMQDYAWVKQTGDGNISLQNQTSSYAYSHVYQQGVDQASVNILVGNTAETKQIGGYNQRANIWQVGARNTAYQSQGLSTGYTSSNLEEATQKGNDNTSHQYQNGSTNTTRIIQSTSFNTANITQGGNRNGATVLQVGGNTNVVNLTQNGGAQANIMQDGSNNTSMGLGIDQIATSFDGSILDLDQIGSGNTLHLRQDNGASATVYQNGISNVSTVIQY